MFKGTVKWFNNAKGWGFILPEAGEWEIFVHFSAIICEGYKKLVNGQFVKYTTKPGKSGLCASEVIPIAKVDSTT